MRPLQKQLSTRSSLSAPHSCRSSTQTSLPHRSASILLAANTRYLITPSHGKVIRMMQAQSNYARTMVVYCMIYDHHKVYEHVHIITDYHPHTLITHSNLTKTNHVDPLHFLTFAIMHRRGKRSLTRNPIHWPPLKSLSLTPTRN